MAAEILNALLNANLITMSQVKAIKDKQEETNEGVVSVLVKNGHLSEIKLMKFFKDQYGIDSADLKNFKMDPMLLDLIESDVAHKYQVIPIEKKGRSLYLGMINPLNENAIEDVSFLTGLSTKPLMVSQIQMQEYLDKYYKRDGHLVAVSDLPQAEQKDIYQPEEEWEEELSMSTSSQAADFVKYIIDDAVSRKASDIHVEFIGKRQRVRMRIDGVLQEVVDAPRKFSLAIIQRVKILSKMDIAEHIKPQDGRIKWRYHGRDIDLRVSVIPTVLGEKVVMRILDKGSLMVDLKDLGFTEQSRKKFEDALERPYGIILVTGPTGSGKSTTLYSALSRLNEPGTQIITVEDPVEYNIRGINQIPIRSDIGFDFPDALRAILRHSPDIIMVGEIRDQDTAEIAIRAALAGQLVLSTIHTNDAPSTINRLVDMGIKPFLVAASLNIIQAQRLVRRICPKCKKPIEYDQVYLEEIGYDQEKYGKFTFYKGAGCGYCNNTGYKGRVAITEVMPISRKIRQRIVDGASTAEVKQLAIKEKMITLRADAWLKVSQGVTTIEEIVRETSSL